MPQGFGQCSLCPHSYLSYLVEKQMDQRKTARGLEGTSQVRRWGHAICVDSRMDINEYEHSRHSLNATHHAMFLAQRDEKGLVPVFKEPRDREMQK